MQLSAPTQQACATAVGKVGVDAALSPTGLEGGLRWPVNQPMGSKMMPRLIISAAKVAYYPADVAQDCPHDHECGVGNE